MRQLINWLFVFLSFSITVLEAASECHNYYKMDNLNIQQLEGVWWEYQTFNSYNFPEPHDCLVAKFTTTKNSISIKEDFIPIKDGRDEAKHTTRHYELESNVNIHNINHFTGTVRSGGEKVGQYITYRVLNTDYKNWLIVYICGPDNSFTGGMVLTRNQKVEKPMKETLDKILRRTLSSRPGYSSHWTFISNKYTIIDNEKCKPVDFAAN